MFSALFQIKQLVQKATSLKMTHTSIVELLIYDIIADTGVITVDVIIHSVTVISSTFLLTSLYIK